MKSYLLIISLLFYSQAWGAWPSLPNYGWPSLPIVEVKVTPKVLPKVRAYLFTLENCAPCKQLAPVIDKLIKEKWDITILDANEYRQSYDQWEIEGTPTLIILEEDKDGGTLLHRLTGVQSEDSLRKLFQKIKLIKH